MRRSLVGQRFRNHRWVDQCVSIDLVAMAVAILLTVVLRRWVRSHKEEVATVAIFASIFDCPCELMQKATGRSRSFGAPRTCPAGGA